MALNAVGKMPGNFILLESVHSGNQCYQDVYEAEHTEHIDANIPEFGHFISPSEMSSPFG